MKNYLNIKSFFVWFISLIFVVGGIVLAGSLTPSANPDTATFYTLGDIYSKLTDNTYTNTEGNHDLSTTTAPTGTFATLKDIYEAIPIISSGSILSSTTYMGIQGDVTLPGEADVKMGVAYGSANSLTGTLTPAPVIIWSNSNDYSGNTDWYTASSTCVAKTTGGYTWRLPTGAELWQLYIDSGGTPLGFNASYYWSGTTLPSNSNGAYQVGLNYGAISYDNKNLPNFLVRCVRDK